MNTTSDPKEHTIRVRLNDEMHDHVLRKSAGRTISDYIRSLIQSDIYQEHFQKYPKLQKEVSFDVEEF